MNAVQDEQHDWLTGCEGFRVDAPDGRLGYVGDVRRDPTSGRAEALVVRAGRLGGHHHLVVPVDEIAGIVLSGRSVVVRRRLPDER